MQIADWTLRCLVGPLLDNEFIRGISVFQVASAAEARALAEADPAVQAGRFVVELHPWMAQQGIRVLSSSIECVMRKRSNTAS